MKKNPWILVAALSAACSIGLARAGNEGPAGVPPMQREALAEARWGGSVAPFPGLARGVRIRVDGVVESFRDNRVTPLAQLRPETVAKLVERVEAAPAPGPLVDQEPGAPRCVGAPITSYWVFPLNREPLAFAESMDCHAFSREDGYGSGIRQLLDGFESLSY